jgi:predicted Zn-dependent protease
MSNFIPHPSPDVMELVHACGQHLRQLDPHELRKVFQSQGSSHLTDPTPSQLEAVYDTTCQLCDEGNFRFAAALALHLVTHKPSDPRFGFIAGTCMQRLGFHANAGQLFCCSLVAGGDHPAAFYRLAECLLALGDNANAEKALDAAIDLSRHQEQAGPLQAMAHELLDNIKRSSR